LFGPGGIGMDLLGDREIVLVPFGGLYSVPWESLPTLRGRGVSVAPSATAWVSAMESERSPGPVVLVLGPNLPESVSELDQLREVYPDGFSTTVEVRGISAPLEGIVRGPEHFRGVATVVTKLFNIVQPGIAYFGEKDAQQLAVIRRMAAGLNMPISIVGVATVRAPDGLALSSRNERLTREERLCAPLLFQALNAARREVADVAGSRAAGLDVLAKEPRIRVEYFEVVDAESMQPVTSAAGRMCIAGAIWLGGVRLIDNVLVTGKAPS